MTGQGNDASSDPNRELRELVASVARSVQANSEAIAELREGQKMMMQIFQERDAQFGMALKVFEQRTDAFEREMQVMRQEIADLRRDFLEFVMRDRNSES